MKRILLIEDDPEIAHLLQLELGDAGFEVDWAPGGMSGLVRLREAPPDLVILDLGLPDLDGGEVARRIRVGAEVPIIVLTAADSVERKVTLLSGGADDYIVKPFHPAELLARIQVQLRHREGGEQVTIGELEVHLSKRQVFYDGQEVRLSPKEFELLSLLCTRPGKVFSRTEIEEHLWGRSLERDSNVVDVHVANLRSKLRESGAYGYLRTVRGVGYALRQRDKE
ncbi:two component transcriptional regulator, winged helix family [Allomeiothermus silvanus DSM 9946]|uniref:Two component transcriptional regulator, winged helix family n=1 Tax=Allomeiothermus silvanus (strain ATCC 700542 / DSM 9946 / NBRC 106475 / NCIMB 13440 / VI-R2) TaxID=526227 RepID=D7BD87_ALLS1|nr:response regulator transcription factor [Allomeiothermus silvanus]ADH63005.1 two component transcriptional regulator, winged helix family [Allomeiothermus silvanus DSM 9946]